MGGGILMPFGEFLDTLPAEMFIVVHVVLLLVALWVFKKASDKKLKYAKAFLLYALVHVSFLAMLGGLLTLKMSVFIEQVLIVVMVLWIIMNA